MARGWLEATLGDGSHPHLGSEQLVIRNSDSALGGRVPVRKED